ncbi:MAG: hypothetical protein IE883_02800, partial [Epsilonproteobacteria bacterium]|nr:hypothetical protein [Campylobacterota bacterium]
MATNAYGKTDTLYNFENVIGSANGDIIVGNSLSNSILGGAGADTITGGAGSDILLGAAGDDKFIFTNTEFGADTSVGGGDDTDTLEITDAAAVSDSDFSNISMMEKIVLSSDNAHTLTLGTNANTAGIKEIDATAALSSSVTLNVSSMSNDLKIDTSDTADSVVLSGGADTLHTYNGNDTIEYGSAAKVDNGPSKPSDTIDAGAGTDTLFANSAEDYNLSNASISSVETLKFYQGSADQSIVISGDQNLEITTFEGSAAQNNTLQVENTLSTNNVDLSTGKTLTSIENTIINSNYNINSTLIGNSATKDTITGSAADDVISGLGSDDILNNVANAIKLDQNGVKLQGGTNTDTYTYDQANFDANDTLDGSSGTDELILDSSVGNATKVLSNFANVSNIEKLTLTSGADNLDL